MSFDYRKLDIYSDLSDDEIKVEMRKRKENLPKLFKSIANNEVVKCVICEQGTYVNDKTCFYCNYCGHQIIFN